MLQPGQKTGATFLFFYRGHFKGINAGHGSRTPDISELLWDLSPEKQPDGQDSRVAAGAHIRAALEQGSNQFEWIHKRKDGSTFTADVLLSAYELSGKQVIFTSIRDITGRIQIKNVLRRSEGVRRP
jgi:hypothetical protein